MKELVLIVDIAAARLLLDRYVAPLFCVGM